MKKIFMKKHYCLNHDWLDFKIYRIEDKRKLNAKSILMSC